MGYDLADAVPARKRFVSTFFFSYLFFLGMSRFPSKNRFGEVFCFFLHEVKCTPGAHQTKRKMKKKRFLISSTYRLVVSFWFLYCIVCKRQEAHSPRWVRDTILTHVRSTSSGFEGANRCFFQWRRNETLLLGGGGGAISGTTEKWDPNFCVGRRGMNGHVGILSDVSSIIPEEDGMNFPVWYWMLHQLSVEYWW